MHADVPPIIPSTDEVQVEASIMSRIMSDATDGVCNLHGYSEYPFNQLLNDVDEIVHEVAEQKLADGLVAEQMTEVVEVVRYSMMIRFHSASQEEANAVAVILRPE